MEICKVHERFIYHFYNVFNIQTKEIPKPINEYYYISYNEKENMVVCNKHNYRITQSPHVTTEDVIARMIDMSEYLKALEILPMIYFKKIIDFKKVNFTSFKDDVIYTLNHHNIPSEIDIMYIYKEYLNMFDFELIGTKGEYELYNLIPKKYPLTYV